MRDEVREEVRQKAEKGQAGNAVGGKYPGAAAFVFAGGGGLLNCRIDDRGPIFHARKPPRERPWRKNVMRHACPASWPGRTIWTEFYYCLGRRNQEIAIAGDVTDV